MNTEVQNVNIMTMPSLISAVNYEHKQVIMAGRDMIDHADKCGEMLKEVKEQVGHGNFGNWIDDNFQASERTAQRYMQVHEIRQENPSQVADLDTIGDVLGYSRQLKTISAASAPTELPSEIDVNAGPPPEPQLITKPLEIYYETAEQDVTDLGTSPAAESAESEPEEVPITYPDVSEEEVVEVTPEIEAFAKDIVSATKDNVEEEVIVPGLLQAEDTFDLTNIKGRSEFSLNDARKWLSVRNDLHEMSVSLTEVENTSLTSAIASAALDEASQTSRKVSNALQELSEALAREGNSKINVENI